MSLSEEKKEILAVLDSGYRDITAKLDAIEKLLGERMGELPAVALDAIVDDVFKYNRQLADIYGYVSRQIDSELRTMLMKHIEERFAERLKKGTSDGDRK